MDLILDGVSVWLAALARFGWREWLLVLILLVVVYMVVQFLRMNRLTREADRQVDGFSAAPAANRQTPPLGAAAYREIAQVDDDEPRLPDPPPAAPQKPKSRVVWFKRDEEKAEETAEPPPMPKLSTFTGDMAAAVDEGRLERLEAENRVLRSELDGLRTAFASLRDEMQREVEHLGNQFKATQQVSPLYGDAMQMALAGESADVIAGRCGIARAEAELVVALVQSRQEQSMSEIDNWTPDVFGSRARRG